MRTSSRRKAFQATRDATAAAAAAENRPTTTTQDK